MSPKKYVKIQVYLMSEFAGDLMIFLRGINNFNLMLYLLWEYVHLASKSKKIPNNYFQNVNLTQRPLDTVILFHFTFDFLLQQNMVRLPQRDQSI